MICGGQVGDSPLGVGAPGTLNLLVVLQLQLSVAWLTSLPSLDLSCRRDIHKVDRPPLQLAILERILTGGHRTTDGANADFYYIPASARDLKKTYHLIPLFQYISQTWPYWNATGGKRHIMPAEGGFLGSWHAAQPPAQTVSWPPCSPHMR